MDHHLSDTLLLLGLVLALLWVLSVKKRKQCLRLPPGPRALPIVGNLHQLDKRAPVTSLARLSETYGPVMTVYLGPKRAVVLAGYDAVREALVEQADDFAGRGAPPFFLRVTRGHGIITSNGERHRQLRLFTLGALKDFGMGRRGVEQWIQEEDGHLAARIEDTGGAPFDPTPLLGCAVSNVIGRLVFGQRFDDARLLRLLAVVSDTVSFFSSPLAQLYNVFPWLMERVPGRHHDCFAGIEELKEFIVERIKEHRETMDPDSPPRDYIDRFLQRADREKELRTSEFHHDNLVATVLNLFQAGAEPTGATIRFTLSVLIKHPDVQERMQREIDDVIGRGRSPNMGDRKSLPFTNAVIHETQRFLDIVPLSVPHCALRDVSFRGYSIPEGTLIVPMLHSVLRDEGRWATPWAFDPQHFLDRDTGAFKKNPAFLPFSAGKRECVGQSLARAMLFLFVASLLQRFSFSCSAGPDSIDLSPEFSSFANVPRRYHVIATPR